MKVAESAKMRVVRGTRHLAVYALKILRNPPPFCYRYQKFLSRCLKEPKRLVRSLITHRFRLAHLLNLDLPYGMSAHFFLLRGPVKEIKAYCTSTYCHHQEIEKK